MPRCAACLLLVLLLAIALAACSAHGEGRSSGAAGALGRATSSAAPGLTGNYGYLTDYSCMAEEDARGRIDQMVGSFGITDVQFYDWFASYSSPTAGSEWTDPWFHQRPICLQTIAWYIDELHLLGARAWAYVQSIAAESEDLRNQAAGIYPLVDASGAWFHMGSHPTYFANAAWARHQVAAWGPQVAAMGFDGVHWDTLGPIAGSYGAETAGFHAFLVEAAPLLANLGLKQTLNFVNLSWWDESLLDVVAFPYAEVWSMAIEQRLYAAMADPAMQARWGVMAFYPSQDGPPGWTQSQVMLARWNAAPTHHVRYLVVGDGARRLVDEYFPGGVPLTPDEISAMSPGPSAERSRPF
jgi:hypothetical protein